MEIIDAHHHLWDTRDLDYELFRNRSELQGSFRLARYEAEARTCGVTGSILVEAASAGADPVLETEWLLREIEGSDFVKGLVAWAPLDDPIRLESHLDWLQAKAGKKLVGVRRSFEREPDDFPRRHKVIEGCRIAGEHGLVVDLVMFSRTLAAVVDLVDGSPGTRFVLDHLGKPPLRQPPSHRWMSTIADIGARPNVACKISGLAGESGPTWDPLLVMPYVKHAISMFEPSRLIYGSDWPILGPLEDHRQWFDFVASAAAASQALENEMMFDDATEWYGLRRA